MKISEFTIYKLEATNKELDISIYDMTDESRSPYYKLNNIWYSTGGSNRYIYPVDSNYPLSKRLEENFKEMMPFKGQLELF